MKDIFEIYKYCYVINKYQEKQEIENINILKRTNI